MAMKPQFHSALDLLVLKHAPGHRLGQLLYAALLHERDQGGSDAAKDERVGRRLFEIPDDELERRIRKFVEAR